MDDVDFDEFASIFKKIIGVKSSISNERFKEVCTPEYFVKVRSLPGGPSEKSMKSDLDIHKKNLEEYKKHISNVEKFINDSANQISII